jgi:hypothetical protein
MQEEKIVMDMATLHLTYSRMVPQMIVSAPISVLIVCFGIQGSSSFERLSFTVGCFKMMHSYNGNTTWTWISSIDE